jgi:hypothetical protein
LWLGALYLLDFLAYLLKAIRVLVQVALDFRSGAACVNR